MTAKKFPVPLLALAIIFWVLTIYSILAFPPTYSIKIVNIPIPMLPLVLISLGLSIFTSITFATRSLLHGILLGSVSILYLVLRLIGLTSLFFLVLLLAICVAVELFFIKKS